MHSAMGARPRWSTPSPTYDRCSALCFALQHPESRVAQQIGYLLFGGLAFYMSRNADPLIKLQCAFLVCTGIGSALYHATGRPGDALLADCSSRLPVRFCSAWYGFGLLDGTPMMILVSFLFLGIFGKNFSRCDAL